MRTRIRELFHLWQAENRNLTRGEYAKLVGVGRSTVNSALDDPYHNMQRGTMEKFALFHGVRLIDLFVEENSEKVMRPLAWSDAVGVVPS